MVYRLSECKNKRVYEKRPVRIYKHRVCSCFCIHNDAGNGTHNITNASISQNIFNMPSTQLRSNLSYSSNQACGVTFKRFAYSYVISIFNKHWYFKLPHKPLCFRPSCIWAMAKKFRSIPDGNVNLNPRLLSNGIILYRGRRSSSCAHNFSYDVAGSIRNSHGCHLKPMGICGHT